jgi:hypothetical protein
MTGFWELDRIAAEDIEKLGRNKKIALDQLGAPMFSTEGMTVWVPHLHAIVDCASLGIDELKEAFRADGRRGAYRVDVQPFHKHRSVAENLKQIVRYSMKFRIEDSYKTGSRFEILDDGLLGDGEIKSERQWWPNEDIRAYAEWAKTTRGGFRSLRFQIGKARKKEVGSENMDAKENSSNKGEFFIEDRFHVITDVVFEKDNMDERSVRYIESGVLIGRDEYNNMYRYKESLHDTNWLSQMVGKSVVTKEENDCQSGCSSMRFVPADNLQGIILFAAASQGAMERHTARSRA